MFLLASVVYRYSCCNDGFIVVYYGDSYVAGYSWVLSQVRAVNYYVARYANLGALPGASVALDAILRWLRVVFFASFARLFVVHGTAVGVCGRGPFYLKYCAFFCLVCVGFRVLVDQLRRGECRTVEDGDRSYHGVYVNEGSGLVAFLRCSRFLMPASCRFGNVGAVYGEGAVFSTRVVYVVLLRF